MSRLDWQFGFMLPKSEKSVANSIALSYNIFIRFKPFTSIAYHSASSKSISAGVDMNIKDTITQNTRKIKDKSIFYILWTGGWDSTFRLVQLSKTDCAIQTVYVLDPNRKSTQHEMDAMARITERLRQRSETTAVIFDVIIIKLQDIPQNETITKAYQTIHERTHLGSQHEWLARLGNLMPGMEVGTEAGTPETSHILDSIQQFCHLEMQDGIGRIIPQQSSPEGMLVLGCFTYPIIDLYEVDMMRLIHEWHYEDVMKMVWFCHTPIHGEPCGLCHPCEVKMESDMEWMLPLKAQKKYRNYKKIKRIAGNKAANLYKVLAAKKE